MISFSAAGRFLKSQNHICFFPLLRSDGRLVLTRFLEKSRPQRPSVFQLMRTKGGPFRRPVRENSSWGKLWRSQSRPSYYPLIHKAVRRRSVESELLRPWWRRLLPRYWGRGWWFLACSLGKGRAFGDISLVLLMVSLSRSMRKFCCCGCQSAKVNKEGGGE